MDIGQTIRDHLRRALEEAQAGAERNDRPSGARRRARGQGPPVTIAAAANVRGRSVAATSDGRTTVVTRDGKTTVTHHPEEQPHHG